MVFGMDISHLSDKEIVHLYSAEKSLIGVVDLDRAVDAEKVMKLCKQELRKRGQRVTYSHQYGYGCAILNHPPRDMRGFYSGLTKHEVRRLINLVGGRKTVARHLGKSMTTVDRWYKTGLLPVRAEIAIEDMATPVI